MCTRECVQTGGDWVAWGRAIHTHTHICTHTLSPPLPLGLVVPAAPLLLYWVPGWPVVFSSSNAPFVFVLLFLEWKGGSYTLGRVMDWRLRKQESDSESDIDTERESGRNLGVSLLLWAQWKPSRGSRLDNLSEAPRLFSKAAWLLTAVAMAVVVTRTSKPRDKSFRLTLSLPSLVIYPGCIWLLPPCSSATPHPHPLYLSLYRFIVKNFSYWATLHISSIVCVNIFELVTDLGLHFIRISFKLILAVCRFEQSLLTQNELNIFQWFRSWNKTE